ncbi:MAG: HEAT repeat domain-containing protein, partial [Tepidisphaeraceae bacterium]
PDPSVREAAAGLLVDAPTPRLVDVLVRQLEVDYRPLHKTARAALVATGQDSVPAMVALLDHRDARRREDALYVLWKLKSDAGLTRQIALMKDADWGVVAMAARSLGAAGRPEAVPAVAELAGSAMDAMKRATEGAATGDPVSTGRMMEAITQSIVACGKLGHRAVLPRLLPMLPDFEKTPGDFRAATCWLVGVTGDAQIDAATCGQMFGLLSNPMDSEPVKFEAIKALGHLRYQPAAGTFANWETEAILSSSPALRWISHWAHERITGTTTPYKPPVSQWTAETAIMDLPVRNGGG